MPKHKDEVTATATERTEITGKKKVALTNGVIGKLLPEFKGMFRGHQKIRAGKSAEQQDNNKSSAPQSGKRIDYGTFTLSNK